MTTKNKMTKRLALGGVMAALAITLLYLFGMTAFDLSVLVLCALMTMLIMVECGVKVTWIYAAVTAVLAILLLPSKLYAIQYLVFSAIYPILKMYFERLPAMFAWLLKISCLDSMLMLCLVLVRLVFTTADFFPFTMPTFIFGTIFFVFFDLMMTLCISVYMIKLRKIFKLQK